MKIYYFNDESFPVSVFYRYAMHGPAAVLQPASGAFFDIKIPKGCSPLIKKWKDYAMISYIDSKAYSGTGNVYKGSRKLEWERNQK